jgi:hypothetical protein
MKKYFHYDGDQFDKMEESDILEVLNQAIAEFEDK